MQDDDLGSEHLYVCSLEEVTPAWLAAAVSKGSLTPKQAESIRKFNEGRREPGSEATILEILEEHWGANKRAYSIGAKSAQAGVDFVLARRIALELGSWGAKVAYRRYNGKMHIIIKGYPGLRSFLTGTRYSITNPKIVQIGLSPQMSSAAMRKGGILSVLLTTGYNVIDYVLSDNQMLTDFLGQMASDLIKIAVSVAASVGVAALAASAVAGTTIAIPAVGVVLVGLAVGTLVGVALDWLDEEFKLTVKFKRFLNELSREMESWLQQRRREAAAYMSDLMDDVEEAVSETVERLVLSFLESSGRKVEKIVRRKYCEITFCYP